MNEEGPIEELTRLERRKKALRKELKELDEWVKDLVMTIRDQCPYLQVRPRKVNGGIIIRDYCVRRRRAISRKEWITCRNCLYLEGTGGEKAAMGIPPKEWEPMIWRPD